MAKKEIKIERAHYPLNYREAINVFQKAYVERALAAHKGNITCTARALGISRRTLQLRLHQKSVQSPKKQEHNKTGTIA